ncbi:MAG: hypothetical protein ACKO34_03615 [Vampirovibrionales bacterium]
MSSTVFHDPSRFTLPRVAYGHTLTVDTLDSFSRKASYPFVIAPQVANDQGLTHHFNADAYYGNPLHDPSDTVQGSAFLASPPSGLSSSGCGWRLHYLK